MNEREVMSLLESRDIKWGEFSNWMIGKTLSMDEKGNTIYWTRDVRNFLKTKGYDLDL